MLFHAAAGAEAGEYRTEITVKVENEIIDRGEIIINVWNFTLPGAHAMETASQLGKKELAKFHSVQGDALDELYVKYYEFMLEHHLCAYNLPYDILDSRANRYLDDERVTTFKIPYSENDEIIKKYYDKLSGKPEWLKKGFFYPLDEPGTPEQYEKLHEAGERLKRLFPGYRMCVPFFQNPDMPEGRDAIDYAAEVMNVWCPKLYCFDSENIYNERQLAEKKPFAERMRRQAEAGDDIWWYVCWEPGEPYGNLYVNMQGAASRVIFWQAYIYNVTGFLYWHSNYWQHTGNPWESMSTVPWLTRDCYGDGSLLYNGSEVGMNGPCSSLRLEAVRDGIDDYEYITMAKKLGVPAKEIDEIVKPVARSITDYTRDDRVIEEARVALGKIVEKYSVK